MIPLHARVLYPDDDALASGAGGPGGGCVDVRHTPLDSDRIAWRRRHERARRPRLDTTHGTIRFDGAHGGLCGEQIDERTIAREGQRVGGPVGAVRHAARVQQGAEPALAAFGPVPQATIDVPTTGSTIAQTWRRAHVRAA